MPTIGGQGHPGGSPRTLKRCQLGAQIERLAQAIAAALNVKIERLLKWPQ